MTTTYVIDLETAPRDGDPPPCPDAFLNRGIRSNFKPDTVKEHQAKNQILWDEGEWKKVASLDWRLGQIVAAGVMIDGEAFLYHTGVTSFESDGHHVSERANERALIEGLMDGIYDISKGRLVGFNHRNFDLPWIAGRAMVHNVPCKLPRASRYDPTRITDWCDILSNYGSFDMKGWSLDAYAKLYNLEHQPWGDGKQVGEWYTNGEHDKILRHLLSDLLMTYDLDKRCAPSLGLE